MIEYFILNTHFKHNEKYIYTIIPITEILYGGYLNNLDKECRIQ